MAAKPLMRDSTGNYPSDPEIETNYSSIQWVGGSTNPNIRGVTPAGYLGPPTSNGNNQTASILMRGNSTKVKISYSYSGGSDGDTAAQVTLDAGGGVDPDD